MTFSSIITSNRSDVNQNPPNFPNAATLATNSETNPPCAPIFDLPTHEAEVLASQLPAYLTQEGVEVRPFDLLVEEVEAECAEQEAVEELLFDLQFCGGCACRMTIFTI